MLTLCRTVNPLNSSHGHSCTLSLLVVTFTILFTRIVLFSLPGFIMNMKINMSMHTLSHTHTHCPRCAHQHLYLLSHPQANTYTALPLLCLHLRACGVKVLRPVHSLCRVAVSCCLPVTERCGAWTNTLSVLLLSLIVDQLGPNPLCAIR